MEGRAGANGRLRSQSTCRTQRRESVIQEAPRPRRRASRRNASKVRRSSDRRQEPCALARLHGSVRGAPGNRRPYRDEADIESFFDSLDRTRLEEMLRIRVADGSLRRLVGKCVRVGVLDGEERVEPARGTPQGSGLSPLLGNLYLHHTLDVWFEREVKPRLGGEAVLVRYCDDFVIGFERREDAQRVEKVLGKRMERFGLTLHPEKTRLIAFERPRARERGGKGPGTFDFLGFTMYWRRTRHGRWEMWCKTRGESLRRFNRAVAEWCRRHRHHEVQAQHAALKRRLVGHFNYFGVNGNARSMMRVRHATIRVWFKWLRRRSQRTRLTWERFARLLERFPLPRPRVVVRIWGG